MTSTVLPSASGKDPIGFTDRSGSLSHLRGGRRTASLHRQHDADVNENDRPICLVRDGRDALSSPRQASKEDSGHHRVELRPEAAIASIDELRGMTTCSFAEVTGSHHDELPKDLHQLFWSPADNQSAMDLPDYAKPTTTSPAAVTCTRIAADE
jgi:hypothetical protein